MEYLVNEPADADSAVMLFLASGALMFGLLLVINPKWFADFGANRIRLMQGLYGKRTTDRFADGSTMRRASTFGSVVLLFGLAMFVLMFFRLHVPISAASSAMAGGLGSLQMLTAAMMIWKGRKLRRHSQQSRRGQSAQASLFMSAVLVGVCGALTILGLALLLLAAIQ